MVNMDDKDIEALAREVYEEGYKNLTGKDWEGVDKDLFETVNEIELGGYNIKSRK